MTQSSYQVIARRWRPRQFDEIVGQEHIVRTLKNAIESNRIAHAYLFVGPRGTGKTTTARIFAKALNAEGGPNVAPDDNSAISKAILSGSCMDVIEIDGASNNGVEDVRSLREDVQYAPSQGNFKVYIIDEVHMLSNNAWNALLKTLEEPPAHVKFIFATTEAHKVLPTVVSRCQRFEFRPIPEVQIVQRLRQIADTENIEVEEAALLSVARMADGGMRDAQSILDQLISFCGNSITDQNVLEVYGLASREDIEAMVRAMAAADYEALFAKIEEQTSQGKDLYRILQDIQARVREALVEAIHGGGHTSALGVPMSAEALTRMLEGIQQGEGAVRTGLSQRVNFEVALLRAIDQSRSRAIDSVIKSLTQIAAGLPEDAGQKKIGTSPAAAESGFFAAPVARKGPFHFPMLGGALEKSACAGAAGVTGAAGFARAAGASGVASRHSADAGAGAVGTGAAGADTDAFSFGGDSSSLATASSAASARGNAGAAVSGADDEHEAVSAFSPFSSPDPDADATSAAGGESDWERTLSQADAAAEFLAHPEDEEDGDSAAGAGRVPGGSLAVVMASGKASARAQGEKRKIRCDAGTEAFNCALEKVSQQTRQSLEEFLRAEFSYLEREAD